MEKESEQKKSQSNKDFSKRANNRPLKEIFIKKMSKNPAPESKKITEAQMREAREKVRLMKKNGEPSEQIKKYSDIVNSFYRQ